MPKKYDPVAKRDYWLRFGIKIQSGFKLPEEPALRASYANHTVNSLLDAVFVGLAEEVRPAIGKLLEWMEAQPEPDRLSFKAVGSHIGPWWYAIYQWRRALGLCRWLMRVAHADENFAHALEAQRIAMSEGDSQQGESARAYLQEDPASCLALALAGKDPDIGLRLCEMAGVKRSSGLTAPIVKYGLWACRHLAEGGLRDATFVTQGGQMLTKSLLPKFFPEAEKVEPALWLKAIYFDSGIAKTPEQAIAMAYDSMPGVERPDFV